MILLRLISWPYVRRHFVRSLLTTGGIVLGVAVFVGMHTANRSVFFAFERTVDRIAGATELQVSAGETGFPEDVLERVQGLPEVRVAVPVIEAVAGTGRGQGNVLVLGIDMTGDRSLRDYDLESGEEAIIDDPLVFLAQPDSIMVTREFASRNDLDVDDRVTLQTPHGERAFTVRGVMRGDGLASAFGGNLAVMDIYAAQAMFGRGRTFDRIDLALADGVSIERGRAALRALLGGGFEVEQPGARAEQFQAMLSVYSMTSTISSLFALFIGMFIIYNAFAIAVTERRSEIGILRALGASRARIRALFLSESALAGLAGSLGGVALGAVMARSMAGYVGGMLEGIYGIAERAEEVSADPWLIAGAVGIGILTSMVAAWIPARNAARVDPVHALQKGRYQVLSAGENRVRRMLALVLASVSVAVLVAGRAGSFFYAAYALAIVAALLLTPSAAMWVARGIRPILRWLRPVEGALAADSLLQAPRRTSGTAAALMLAVAQVIGLGGVSQSSYSSIVDWIDTALNPDIFVAGSSNLSDRTFRFPVEVSDRVRAVPGVEELQRVRSFRVQYRGSPVLVVAVELESIGRRALKEAIAGNRGTMFAEAAAGRGLIVSENFAELQNVSLGSDVALAAPFGTLEGRVIGIIEDWSDQQGTIFVDRATLARYWHDDTANVLRVYVADGASIAAVRAGILDAVGAGRRLVVMTNQDVRRYILELTGQWLTLTYVQILVAVLVAVLGIVNTLTVSIMDRRRELGVLQAVGALRGQVRRTIWMEAMATGIVGTVLGLALGAVNLYYVLQVTARDLSGMRLPYEFPIEIAALVMPFILLAAFLAAIWPGEAAVRGSLVAALEYE
jgi:putative ABC transport system permease protein